MKKIICMLLVAIMTLTMFAACSNGTDTEASQTPAGTPDVSASTSEAPANTTDVSAGTSEAPANGLRVGFSLTTLTFPYYVRMHDQLMTEAEKRGWNVTFVDGNMDAGEQLNGLQDLLNNGVDAMVVGSWYFDAMADIFVQCKDKGIPVFQIANNEISDATKDLVTFATGTSHYDAGYLGGVWCAGYLKEKGKTSINVALMTASSDKIKLRGTGFCDALKANGITVNVLNEYDASSRETAMSAAEDALTAYSNIDLFFGASAQGGLGAYDATVGASRTEVMVMGYDGEDEELKLIDKGTNYIGTVTQDPAGEATVTAEYMDKWIKGETFEQTYKVPAGIYCAEGQLTSDQVLGTK